MRTLLISVLFILSINCIAQHSTNFERRFTQLDGSGLKIVNKDGSHSTHRMIYFECNGKYICCPTIVQLKGCNYLVRLRNKDAMRYALDTQEYVTFSIEKEAVVYASGGYKKGYIKSNH